MFSLKFQVPDMKAIVIITLSCLLGFAAAGLCQDEDLAPEWVFDDEDEVAKWNVANQLQPLEV